MSYRVPPTSLLKRNHLTNLSTLPTPITQSWEFSIPIPYWILRFFHIEGGLLITFRVTISANRTDKVNNSFVLNVTFRQQSERSLPPRTIKESEIVFGYLWPNLYYQIDKNLINHTLSEGSSYSGSITLVDPETPELTEVQLPPPPIPEIPELPGIAELNHRTEILQRIEDHNRRVRELPLTPEERFESLLARIWSGENLDQLAFSEGNITYRQLWRIDQLANPQFYTETSLLEDTDYKPPCVKDTEHPGEEEEEEEERPLPIPGPLGTHSRIPPSEPNSPDSSQERLRESLDTHLGMIINEIF